MDAQYCINNCQNNTINNDEKDLHNLIKQKIFETRLKIMDKRR